MTLKILHVYCGPFPTHQGTQTLVKQSCNACVDLNYETHLICYSNGNAEKLNFNTIRINNFIEVTNLRSGPSKRKLFLDALISLKLKQIIPIIKPDIIHAHHYEALIATKMTLPFSNIPIVFHQHALFGPELHTYADKKFKKIFQTSGELMDKHFPSLADKVIVINNFNQKNIYKSNVNKKNVKLILPPAIDFIKSDTFSNSRKIIGIYSGNLDSYQNLDVLYKAIKMLSLKTEKTFELQIVTDSIVNDNLLHQNPEIKFIKHGTVENMFSLLSQADFAIIPRQTPGGVPIKLINALMAGLPVIANKQVVDMLLPDEALLVDTSLPKQIATAIEQLCNSKKQRKQLSDKAQSTINKYFSHKTFCNLLKELYEETLRRV